MKKMFTFNSKSRSRWMLLLLLLVAGVTNTLAQSVTVEPTTGNLIAALTSGSEVGFINGSSAMWRHEQLPLTFTVADDGTLTEGGEISNPAGDMRVHNGYLVVHGGVSNDLYCVLSLPKGYRFTGYKMVLMNNLYGETVANQAKVSHPYFMGTLGLKCFVIAHKYKKLTLT